MTPKERVLSSISGETVDRVPVTSVTQVGTVEAMEKIGAPWPDAHKDPEKMMQLGTSLYKLAGLECARIPFGLTVEAEALGCEINLGRIDRTPQVKTTPFTKGCDITVPENFLSNGRIPVVLETIDRLKQNYGSILPIIVGVTGPFTLTGHLLGVEKLISWMRLKPDEVEAALDGTIEACINYTKVLSEAGADVITVCDPTAAPELISPLQFKTIIKPRLCDLAKEIGVRKVLHICGSTEPIIKDMGDTGFDALSVEEKVDLSSAKKSLEKPGKVIIVAGKKMNLGGGVPSRLIGNVSTAQTLFRGSPSETKAEAKKALAAGVDLLAPACGLAPGTPLENVKSLVEARNEFYGTS
nr:MtaA [uncultured archaeon]